MQPGWRVLFFFAESARANIIFKHYKPDGVILTTVFQRQAEQVRRPFPALRYALGLTLMYLF